MTNPDTPLDLDALTALEKAATPAPWSLEHEGGCIVFGPESSVAEADPADAALIVAMRNQWPVLLSALTAAHAERDEARANALTYLANQGSLNVRLERELAAAREQAKQAQGELAELKVQHAGVQMERDIANEQLRGWRKRAARQRNTAERSMWDETALALLLHAKHVILRAARAHCADDPWRKDASRWVQNHDAFAGTEPVAAGGGDTPTTSGHTDTGEGADNEVAAC